MGKYCVYALNDPDGQPFYIGMGSETRVKIHAGQARCGYMTPRSDKIRELWSQNQNFTTEIVLQTDNYDEAVLLESQLIDAFWDTLTNQRGPNGKIRPSEHDRRQTAIMYVTKSERDMLVRRAASERLNMSEYLRKCCNLQIEKTTKLGLPDADKGGRPSTKGQPATNGKMTETS